MDYLYMTMGKVFMYIPKDLTAVVLLATQQGHILIDSGILFPKSWNC